jgi:hypothetical protein
MSNSNFHAENKDHAFRHYLHTSKNECTLRMHVYPYLVSKNTELILLKLVFDLYAGSCKESLILPWHNQLSLCN